MDRSHVYDEYENPLYSVPESKESLQKYVKKVVNKIRTDICDMNDEAGRDYSYWEISRVVREDLRAVPIRAYNQIRIRKMNRREVENIQTMVCNWSQVCFQCWCGKYSLTYLHI